MFAEGTYFCFAIVFHRFWMIQLIISLKLLFCCHPDSQCDFNKCENGDFFTTMDHLFGLGMPYPQKN
jgi:hypothetical protein